MKVYLVAVGGTGINCLQSFLYVNAISSHGFTEKVDYEVLFVDPDSTGSYTDLVESIVGYRALKKAIDEEKERLLREEEGSRRRRRESDVSVEQFAANFTINDKWTIATQLDRQLIELCEDKDVSADEATEEDLLRVFYKKKYLNMNFSGGFHGVPNVGTLVTKHFMDRDGSSWKAFLEKISREDKETHIVIMGSIFGGTGAAGIPALMNKLVEEEVYKNAKLHVLMMLPYFELPDEDDVKKISKDKIKYGLGNMNLNSAYALEYYESLPSDIVEKFSFIMVGQPQKDLIKNEDYEESGKEQKNKAMIAELVASFLIIHSIKESKLLAEGSDDKSMLIMSTFRTEDAENGFIDFDGIPYTEGFVKKIAVMKFMAQVFVDRLEAVFKRSLSDRNTEETYVFEQKLSAIDENQIKYTENFFKHFIEWSKNINFVNIKDKEELENILYSFSKEPKKPVYKFKPNADDMTEDVFTFNNFIDLVNDYVRESELLTFTGIAVDIISLLTTGSIKTGTMLLSSAAILYKLIVKIEKDEEKEKK